MHHNQVKYSKIFIENHNYMLENTIASNKSTDGTKLGFFLVRSRYYGLVPHFSQSVPERLRSLL